MDNSLLLINWVNSGHDVSVASQMLRGWGRRGEVDVVKSVKYGGRGREKWVKRSNTW